MFKVMAMIRKVSCNNTRNVSKVFSNRRKAFEWLDKLGRRFDVMSSIVDQDDDCEEMDVLDQMQALV